MKQLTFSLICFCLLSTTLRSTSLSEGSPVYSGVIHVILFQIYLHSKTLTVSLQPTAADRVCVITFLKLVFEISAEAVTGPLAV